MGNKVQQLNSETERVARNTLMLYFRQILILMIGLYTVRVILNVLGAEDYGIYNVVAGVVTMFSFLSNSMATASQRYLSFALGKNEDELFWEKNGNLLLKKTFSVTFTVYVILAIAVFVLAETLGLWYINTQLVISSDRLPAALWIYQFAIASFVITMLTTPYMSDIIAHEDMSIYAYVSIVEASLKLGIVFLLKNLPYDKLVVYGALLLIVSIINTSLYRTFCRRKYSECKISFIWDKDLFKESFAFTGWTLFGSFTSVLRNQAITILLNQVFGPIVVSARSIAMNVANYVNIFSNNFNTGLYPSIIKEYASGNKKKMFSFVLNGSKLTFFLMWIFTLPMYMHMDIVLQLWLGTPVEKSVLFTRLALIETLINSISMPISTAARAPGNMKAYEFILGTLQILIFLFSFILLKNGYAVEVVYYVAIIINIIMFIVRLVLVKKLVGLELKSFIYQVMFPIFEMVIISGVPTVMTFLYLPKTFGFRCINVLLSMALSTVSMYFLGMDRDSRTNIKKFIKYKLKKLPLRQ